MSVVVLTGIRSNNRVTLGNYLGVMLPIIKMAQQKADDYQINLFIPDLHSITTEVDYSKIYQNTIDHLKLFIAAGLPVDHPNVHIYRQSYISAHCELTWILDCFASFGELSRMTQFKDKSQNNHNPSVGLFNYPVLMAADILLYNANYIPVGEDQIQHLEFTRNLAQRFNYKFNDIFTVPEEITKQNKFFGIQKPLRIKDLVNPNKKMSKSSNSDRGVIFLEDDPKVSMNKINKATTDNLAKISYDPINQPGISNLIEILSLLEDVSIKEIVKDTLKETQYSDFKEIVAKSYYKFANNLLNNLKKVDEKKLIAKLSSDEALMNNIANQTLNKVQKAIGLRK